MLIARFTSVSNPLSKVSIPKRQIKMSNPKQNTQNSPLASPACRYCTDQHHPYPYPYPYPCYLQHTATFPLSLTEQNRFTPPACQSAIEKQPPARTQGMFQVYPIHTYTHTSHPSHCCLRICAICNQQSPPPKKHKSRFPSSRLCERASSSARKNNPASEVRAPYAILHSLAGGSSLHEANKDMLACGFADPKKNGQVYTHAKSHAIVDLRYLLVVSSGLLC